MGKEITRGSDGESNEEGGNYKGRKRQEDTEMKRGGNKGRRHEVDTKETKGGREIGEGGEKQRERKN